MVDSYDNYFGMTATEYLRMRRTTQTRQSCTSGILCNLLVSILLRFFALSTNLFAHKIGIYSLVLQVQGSTQGHHESSTRISSAVLGKAMRRLSTS